MFSPRSLALIVPVRNTGRFFPSLLSSLASQSGSALSRWELLAVIVDDGSDDPDTLEALTALPARVGPFSVQVVRNEHPAGISAARNKGIRATESDWIAFLDSDDLLLPEGLDLRLQAVEAFGHAKFISSDIHYWHELEGEAFPGKLRYCAIPELAAQISTNDAKPFFIEDSFSTFFRFIPVHTNTALVRRELVEAAGMFDESLRRCEDTDLWIRLSMLSDVLFVPAPTAVYRRHAGGITQTRENEATYMLKVMDKLLGSPLTRERRRHVSAAVHRLCLDSCYYHAQRGESVLCVRYFARALRQRPWSLNNLKFAKQVLRSFLPR